nr:4145_t:CDS:2 [Entrophospora candida]
MQTSNIINKTVHKNFLVPPNIEVKDSSNNPNVNKLVEAKKILNSEGAEHFNVIKPVPFNDENIIENSMKYLVTIGELNIEELPYC